MDTKDRKLCLNREEVEDLGDGFLIGAVGKHDAVKAGAREQLAHLGAQTKTLGIFCVHVILDVRHLTTFLLPV